MILTAVINFLVLVFLGRGGDEYTFNEDSLYIVLSFWSITLYCQHNDGVLNVPFSSACAGLSWGLLICVCVQRLQLLLNSPASPALTNQCIRFLCFAFWLFCGGLVFLVLKGEREVECEQCHILVRCVWF